MHTVSPAAVEAARPRLGWRSRLPLHLLLGCIVVTALGVRLCRPSEVVLDILPVPQQGPFSKEDGEPVIDTSGRRVGGRA